MSDNLFNPFPLSDIPSDMSNEMLADILEHNVAMFVPTPAQKYVVEGAERIRTSIPKTPITTPPTVDEVSDDDWCFVRCIPEKLGEPHEFWEQVHGDMARKFWDRDYEAWVPRPFTIEEQTNKG